MPAILRRPPADRYGVRTLNLTLKLAVITIATWESPQPSRSSSGR
jgi:hypothetical protein